MKQLDKINEYTELVCDQIRWKKAHKIISEEIENHIIDQKDAFLEDGLDEPTSVKKAIEEMGDPVIVGMQLDRTHRPRVEWSMIILAVILLFVGIALNYFTKSHDPRVPEMYYFYKTVVVSIVGIAGMIIAYFIDFTIIGKYPKTIFILLTVFIFLTLLFAVEINGVKFWSIPILGVMRISHFIILLPTAITGFIYNMRTKGYLGIILCGIFYLLPIPLLIMSDGGRSSILLYTMECLILLLISIYNGWFNIKRIYGMLLVSIPTVLLTVFFILSGGSFYLARIKTMLNPYLDPHRNGYMAIIVREILSGAKFLGKGTLPTKFNGEISGWVASINTDFLLTTLIHYAGWIPFLIILILILAFIVRGFYLCSKQKSVLGKLVSTSILLTLSIQMLTYVSANLGFLYVLISLPLISYSGITTIVNLILIGILFSTFKYRDLLHDKYVNVESKERKLVEIVNGKIIIDLGIR